MQLILSLIAFIVAGVMVLDFNRRMMSKGWRGARWFEFLVAGVGLLVVIRFLLRLIF